MHRQTRTRQTTVHKKPDLDAYTTFQLRPTSLRTDIYLYLDKLPHHLRLFTIINFGRKYNKGINFKSNERVLLLLVQQRGHLQPDGLSRTIVTPALLLLLLLLPTPSATSTTGAESQAAV